MSCNHEYDHKIKWSPEEEQALRAGVAKHGTGKWKAILNDPDFSPLLSPHRSNVDLKDKWRNIIGGTPRHSYPLPARYNDMILEAISSNNTKTSELDSISSYIKQRTNVPRTFRRKLLRSLQALVSQGKLEQMESFYRIKETTFELPKSDNVMQEFRDRIKASKNRQIEVPSEVIESYSRYVASRIAEAEHKSYVAAQAVEEAERVSQMAEENEALLDLAKAIHEQCSMGYVVLMD